MKASLISKLVILVCILCLVSSFFKIEKYETVNKTPIAKGNNIALIELNGVIAPSTESGFFTKEASASNVLKSLKNAKEDKEIKGVIIKINSPGGTVGMSQNIYNQIMRLRTEKPIVAVMEDTAASGGYYIASAADRIIALEGTLTGSIGVIMSFMDIHNLLRDKLSVHPFVFTSGQFKDAGSGLREVTPEDRALIQGIIDDSYDQFLTAIIKGRVDRNDKYSVEKTILSNNNLRTYADGRIFTGRQAQKLGFVDTIGDIDVAKTMIEKMAQEKFSNKLPAKVINYNIKGGIYESLFSLAENNAKSSLQITDLIPTSMKYNRKPLYLWE